MDTIPKTGSLSILTATLYAVMFSNGLCEWFLDASETPLTLQNQEIPYGYVYEIDVVSLYTEREWTAKKLDLVSTLYFCERKSAPKYLSSLDSIHCT